MNSTSLGRNIIGEAKQRSFNLFPYISGGIMGDFYFGVVLLYNLIPWKAM